MNYLRFSAIVDQNQKGGKAKKVLQFDSMVSPGLKSLDVGKLGIKTNLNFNQPQATQKTLSYLASRTLNINSVGGYTRDRR